MLRNLGRFPLGSAGLWPAKADSQELIDRE